MSEHLQAVHDQAVKLDAEAWSKNVRMVHIHSLTSSWYETEQSLKDFENGCVTDVFYYDGRIERSQKGKVIRVFGEPLKGDDLLYEYERHNLRGEAVKLLNKKYE